MSKLLEASKKLIQQINMSKYIEVSTGYEHELLNNKAVSDLIECIKDEDFNRKAKTMCCLGVRHDCQLNVNDGFCRAEACQYQVLEMSD